ncbi:hypothetical protein J4Q44_G00059310 [Coregonus suidteri]|uniref:UPAR/Ly6 domain-containing protein n=1 Tax=Coregonus suidteri TaxID=861788 RepID=A0AAN8MBT2_9TELE
MLYHSVDTANFKYTRLFKRILSGIQTQFITFVKMNKIIFGILAVVASFMLAESASKFSLTSLTCNKCSVGLLGVCMNAADEVCITNKSSCFTGRATFPSLTSFVGFNTQGCLESIMCNTTTNATLLGATYTSVKTCCDSNKCKPSHD